ncbi:uncharacterized protein LOC105383046 isoform X2 [Plutella xylostella]|uniref:uncharacterized protein LOC105383046 isoform X2 n=1 Tax=Plutella xylostella TaxID=51655 RepID=UPI0020330973|nr:uncharacterized protein LOC105383046 isoform X2 [Plutella xylostella]
MGLLLCISVHHSITCVAARGGGGARGVHLRGRRAAAAAAQSTPRRARCLSADLPRAFKMPLYSDHYYSGSSSYSAPYSYSAAPSIGLSYSASYLNPGSNYSKHSSLGGYSRAPLTPRWSPSSRNYSPMLSTISERSNTGPVRIHSPRRLPPLKRSYAVQNYTPRPIHINTADIDVSRDRYRPKPTYGVPISESAPRVKPVEEEVVVVAEKAPVEPVTNTEEPVPPDPVQIISNEPPTETMCIDNGPFMPRVDEKPETGIDSSPGLHRNTTIKRGRTVVRLHTIKRKDRDSPRKPVDKSNDDEPEPSPGWRERLADDLVYKDSREKKTLGAKLVEKFIVKDKCEEDDDELRILKESIKKEKETISSDLSGSETAVLPHSDISRSKSPDRRCSLELLAQQANILDCLIRSENLDIPTLDLTKVGVEAESNYEIKPTPSMKRRKSNEISNPLQTTQSDHSLHDRINSFRNSRDRPVSRKQSLKKSSSGSSLGRLDSITEFPKDQTTLPAIEEFRQSLKNNESNKHKTNKKITSTVEVSPPTNTIKFKVDAVTIEEKPKPPKREISYQSVVNTTPGTNDLKSQPDKMSEAKSKRYNMKRKTKTLLSVDSDETDTESSNFWDKIGKRETVYLIARKQNIQDEIEKARRAFFLCPEDENPVPDTDNIQNNSKVEEEDNDVFEQALSSQNNESIDSQNEMDITVKQSVEQLVVTKDQQLLVIEEVKTEIQSNDIQVIDNIIAIETAPLEVIKESIQPLNDLITKIETAPESTLNVESSTINKNELNKNNIKSSDESLNEMSNILPVTGSGEVNVNQFGLCQGALHNIDQDIKEKTMPTDAEYETKSESNADKPYIDTKSKNEATNILPATNAEKNVILTDKKDGEIDNKMDKKILAPVITSETVPSDTIGGNIGLISSTQEDSNVLISKASKIEQVKNVQETNTPKFNKCEKIDSQNDICSTTDTSEVTTLTTSLIPPTLVDIRDKATVPDLPKTDLTKNDKITKTEGNPSVSNKCLSEEEKLKSSKLTTQLDSKTTPPKIKNVKTKVKPVNKDKSKSPSDSDKKKPIVKKPLLNTKGVNKKLADPDVLNNIENKESLEPKQENQAPCPIHGSKQAADPIEPVSMKQDESGKSVSKEEATVIPKEDKSLVDKSKIENIPEIKIENKEILNVPTNSYKIKCDEVDKLPEEISKVVEVIQPAKLPSVKKAVTPIKKPVKQEAALRPLIATPRPLQKKSPQVLRPVSSSESSSEEESSVDESDSSGGSAEFFECENNPDGRTSTGSNDSGFDSSAPTSPAGFVHIKKDCDVNCHRKCEKLTANLCGVNQRLLVEALAARPASRRGGDAASTSTAAASNSENTADAQEKALDSSTAYGIFKKTGRFTPPARSIPRFRKYNMDDFHFIKVLGKGSFGKVLLAELRETEYYYAVKCLKKDVVLEDDDVECTLIERKVLALGTNHPYLCHLFATFQTDSHLFFVMEYLNGGDLMFHIQQSGRFPEERARFYAAEIVSGLKFLHKRGIVYRDLKLDNILLDYEGHVRIADFGMCKLQIFLDKTADTFCGTPDYMAPEIIKGLKYSQTVDWWSFGVLLYEMLIGQSPFSGCDEDELFWSICNEMPSYPRFLSQNALTILTRLLDKDARTRLGGMDCMHGDVRDQEFFHTVHWERLESRQLEAPFKPKVRHPLDTQYFDRAFTGERPRLTACEPQVLRSMDQTPFRGFSYTNPNATDR